MPLIIEKLKKNEKKEGNERRAEIRFKQCPNKKSGKNKEQHATKEKKKGIFKNVLYINYFVIIAFFIII